MSTATERSARIGHVPTGPEHLSIGEWAAAFKSAAKRFLADDCMGLAQQVAYNTLLAFFPAAVFLIGFLDLLGAYDTLKEFLDPVTPQAVTNLIDQLQKDSGGGGSTAAVVLGAVGAIWLASGATASIVKAVNRAYEVVETRPFWKVRLIAILLVGASAFVTAGILLMIVFGGKLGEAIADKASLGSTFTWVWDLVRWPLAFVIVLLLFALVYYLAPNKQPRTWKWVTPGSLIGGAAWLALSGLFALYTSFSDAYSATYGALAGGIILLLWLNYSAWALLFGAELNSELDRQADIRAAGGPQAGLVKPARRER